MRVKLLGVVALITLCCSFSSAGDFSFTGNFSNVNQVQFFTFTVTDGSKVTIQSYSYAGGTNTAGTAIKRGGFDPSIALFYGTGPAAALYNIGDDSYGCQQGVRDSVTHVCYDIYWEGTSQPADPNNSAMAFEPGTYTLALTNYGNAPRTRTLGGGFSGTGSAFDCNGNVRTITAGAFTDCLRSARDGHWALDIKGVVSAQLGAVQSVPPTVLTPPTTSGGGGGSGKQTTQATTPTFTQQPTVTASTLTGNTLQSGSGSVTLALVSGRNGSGGGQISAGSFAGGGSGRGGSGGGGGRSGEIVTTSNTVVNSSGSTTTPTASVTGAGTLVQQFNGETGRGGSGGGHGDSGSGGRH